MQATAAKIARIEPPYMVIEPKPENLNRAYSAAHLAGSTARVLRKKKLSSTKGNAQGKSKLVSYVPLSLLYEAGIQINNVYPESNPHCTVNPGQKFASQKAFRWALQ